MYWDCKNTFGVASFSCISNGSSTITLVIELNYCFGLKNYFWGSYGAVSKLELMFTIDSRIFGRGTYSFESNESPKVFLIALGENFL